MNLSKLHILIFLVFSFIGLITSTALPNNYTVNGEFTFYPSQPTVQNWGYSPNQQFLLVIQKSSNKQLYLYNGRQNKFIKKLIINQTQEIDIGVYCFAFSKQSDLLVIGTKLGIVYAYNVDTKNGIVIQDSFMKYDVREQGKQNFIRSISISIDNVIAVGSQKKTTLLTVNKKQNQLEQHTILQFDNLDIYSLSWASDPTDRLFIGGIGVGQNDGIFAMFQISSNDTIATTINKLPTLSVAALPTANLVLQGRSGDIIYVIDITNNQSIFKLDNTNSSSTIIVSQNGLFLAIESGSNLVSIWKQTVDKQVKNLRSLQAVGNYTLLRSQPSDEITMSSDGNQVLFFINLVKKSQRFSLCVNGSYLNKQGQGQCLTCNKQICLTCYGVDNQCESCNIGSFLTQQSCLKCSSSIFGCSQCNQDGTICNKCNKVQFWKQQPNTQGKCDCQQKYYKSLQNKCEQCSKLPHCVTCDSSTNCITCQGQNFNPMAKNGICECNPKYFIDNDQCKLCIDFIDGCSLCDNIKICQICDTKLDFNQQPNTQGQCECRDTYYKNGKQCDLCSIHITDCYQCTQSGDMCTKCNTNKNRKQKPNNQGECDCADFYYQDKNICKLCDQYQKCIQCQDTTTCNLCNDKNNWIKNQDNQCQCMRGYYEDNNKCQSCDVIGCASCSAGKQCDQCLQDKGFNIDPVNQTCQCQQRRYLDILDNQCKLCMNGCQQCDQIDICKTCDDKNYFQKKQNICVCKNGFYINEDGTKCIKCSTLPGCVQCTTGTKCTKCNTTTHFIQDPVDGVCNCMDTYYKQPKTQSCVLCSTSIANCITCSYTTTLTCNACEDDYVLNSQRTKCEQEDGLSPLVVIAIIVGILALAGAAVAIVKCCKKRNSPLEDDQYEALEENK